MFESPIGVDQQGYQDLVGDSARYLEALSQKLAQAYDELYSQNVDIQDLGVATEAIIFAVEKLKEQKITLEAYQKELRKDITKQHGET